VYIEIPQIAQLNFVGLGNYARLLGNDLFWQSMFNTSYILVIQVPLMIGLALALALALNASFLRLKGVFRTAIALPVSANLVAYSTVFLLLFNEQLGFLNYVLAGVGIGPVPWLTDGFWARNTIIAAVTWRWTGYNMIILLAGLQTIPQRAVRSRRDRRCEPVGEVPLRHAPAKQAGHVVRRRTIDDRDVQTVR